MQTSRFPKGEVRPYIKEGLTPHRNRDGLWRSSTHSAVLNTAHLRRVRDDIPLRLWVVALVAFAERFTFWGITAPWRESRVSMKSPFPQTNLLKENYMQNHLHDPVRPGALGFGQAKATTVYCLFDIFYNVAPLVAAWISDVHLGRYNTLFGCTM